MMVPVTSAAEGFPRRAFTVADVERMIAAGIIGEEENFELIEGEIVPMGPKFHAHERIKSAINLAIARALPDDLWLGIETSIFLGERTFIEPDLCVYRRSLKSDEVKGPDVLLAIEVAASSLSYDRGLKAQIYARYGAREMWVIDANKRRTWIHKAPGPSGWASIVELGSADALSTSVMPLFSMTLDEVD